MKNQPTILAPVLAAPNINGNVGSCTVQTVESPTYKGIFTEKFTVVMTNSCTGQIVNNYEYVSYENVTGILVFSAIILILAFVAWIMHSLANLD